ncbi:nitrilase-related carbon-nitrogen hydrolase [uncultured Pseudokineococcus sp.]|uniref:nitrilase-related carbon-nitrogen hydrolase n=1 Tax=uncultured Pseudokineococcus sp. TaxID=1642928 RepID=UPI00263A21FB|nr:nitrilase-related carbon-nitrogen hydrolase [uncultured Pseudokineococcus sp.]
MRLHLLQVGYGDDEPVAARRDRVAALVAAQEGADLVVLPELWAHGGFASATWAERAEALDGPTARAMADAARACDAVVHAGSLVERDGDALHNTSLLLGPDGALLARYRKVHRFGHGRGESEVMTPGEEVVVVDAPLPGGPVGAPTPPVGPGPAVQRGLPVGLATCYDLRFPELFRALVDRGARLVVVPAAWPAARAEHWRLLVRARALEDQVLLAACGTAGTHARTPMAGASAVVGPDGAVLAEAGEAEEVLVVDVDPGVVDAARAAFPVLADRRL